MPELRHSYYIYEFAACTTVTRMPQHLGSPLTTHFQSILWFTRLWLIWRGLEQTTDHERFSRTPLPVGVGAAS